ncbi:RNA 2',3'-cyclic phosphodiesterase [Rubellimicrobium sp. CFH 75288]|uniref:RNA 2',3'-cyclic phosphodiesterase n=1 Tax=Rubellimicrobium sp. CFH 75288 TaxID=2697034 RepID=UPI001412F097|nr:RNA 2',3'-cyclic phosphodiesterase [Rubellimicrobium sp. CFH 75288]NAZ37640.1 RNA 2',3'-cyclic phosphodiesterase [Rubellimicrobium sp. CFH 75288]
MRVFVAIDIPDAVQDALLPLLAALPFGRAVEPDALHLTLAFLGERPLPEVEAAHEALETVTAPPFALQLGGLGVFDERRPTALWAGLREEDGVRRLQARVLSALHGAGLRMERRRFRPHVTLARLGSLAAGEAERLAGFLARWHAFPSPAFTVRDFALWRSTLRPDGAIHEELARYPLAA